MRRSPFRVLVCVSLALAAACGSDTTPQQKSILSVPATETWDLPGLRGPVQVLRTEANVPHVYASTDADAARVLGFLQARDRYFQIELTRRYGQGLLSELVGDAALPSDQGARGRGAVEITQRLLDRLGPDDAALLDAYVDGFNSYITLANDGAHTDTLPLPTELTTIALVLGVEAGSLMKPLTRRDAAGMLTAVLFNSSFASDDLTRQAVADTLATRFTSSPDGALREAGVRDDLFEWVVPVENVSSAPGFGLAQASPLARREDGAKRGRKRIRVPNDVLARALRAEREFDRLRRGLPGADYGSNAWALGRTGTTSGGAILSGDGHLPLSVPSLLWQGAVDTTTFGDRQGANQIGLFFPGIPTMALGTNGHVAWSFTYLYGDLTDWYAEEITLDASGRPASSLFQGAQKPLVALDDTYTIADVPALSSVGRTETWTRWTTFDGRYLASIEGVPATATTVPGPGQTLVQMQGAFVIPKDVDGDGVVSAVSFDYTGFDVSNLVGALVRAGRAANVSEFRDVQRSFVGFAQNFVVADGNGNVHYSGYTATPCRSFLPRTGTGAATRFANGADPRLLLDGTTYGSFAIGLDANEHADETHADDPSRCVVPFDRWPSALNPSDGFVLTANNDLGGLSLDGSLANDEFYLGGPWAPGFRAKTIHDRLAGHVSSHDGTVDAMANLQADHVSHLGLLFTPYLKSAVVDARALTAPATPEETRVRNLYQGEAAAIDDVIARLDAWIANGAPASSGVATFYDANSDAERADAVATMIWNAWFRAFNARVFDDEAIADVLAIDPRFLHTTSLVRFLAGRGPGNPEHLASYEPTRGESVFFDDVTTPAVVESSREILLRSLVDALVWLRSAPDGKGGGGFGTTDPNQWLWGLRHTVAFESLITAFAGDVMGLELLSSLTQIDTGRLPLAQGITASDPRFQVKWFPRPGDFFDVDAANPPYSGNDYTYRNGPVMRMVIELDHGTVRGRNVVPQGQSGIAGQPSFDDQIKLWLANDALPLRYTVEEVVAGATGREVYR